MSSPSRRDVLRACGVGVAAIAGCAGRDESSEATTTTRTRTTTPPTETTTATTKTTEQTTTENEQSECVPTALPAEDWPLPDRGPANTNYAPTATGATQKPSVRWKQKAEQPDGVDFISIEFTDPVVTSDRVFVGKALLPGTEREMPDENYLHAYDRATGERVWAASTGTDAPRSVAVMDGTVYVETEHSVHAVRRRDGTHRWTRSPTENVVGMLPHEDRIYAVSGLGTVTALRTDGSVAWTTSAGEYARPCPAVHDDTVYVGTTDAGLTALRADDGSERWSASISDPASETQEIVGEVAVTGCGVFATLTRTVAALDFDGTVRWRASGGKYSLSTDGWRLYTGTEDGRLRVLSAEDGSVAWETSLGNGTSERVSGVYEDSAVTDSSLYVSARPGSLHALDAADGTERWHRGFDLPERPGKPVVADEELFLAAGPELLALA